MSIKLETSTNIPTHQIFNESNRSFISRLKKMATANQPEHCILYLMVNKQDDGNNVSMVHSIRSTTWNFKCKKSLKEEADNFQTLQNVDIEATELHETSTQSNQSSAISSSFWNENHVPDYDRIEKRIKSNKSWPSSIQITIFKNLELRFQHFQKRKKEKQKTKQ